MSGIVHKSDSTFYWVSKLLHQREGSSSCPANDNAVALLFTILSDWANGTVPPFQSGPGSDGKSEPKMATVMEILHKYYYGGKDIGFQGKRDCWLYIILPVLYATRPIDFSTNVVSVPDYDPSIYYNMNLSQQANLLDDYCFDIHTKKGKKLQKSVYDFAQEGALVTNQEDKLLNQDYRKIYVYSKLSQMGTSHAESKNIIKSIKYNTQFALPTATQPFSPKTEEEIPIPPKKFKIKKIEFIVPEVPVVTENPISTETESQAKLPTPVKVINKIKIKSVKKIEPMVVPMVEPTNKMGPTNAGIPSPKKTTTGTNNNNNNSNSNSNSNSEKQRFRDVVRAQLTCSVNRPDVYFAIDNDTNKRVVVKGPFMDINGPLNNALFLNHIKGLLGLRSVDMEVANLVPDMWSHVPIGLRNKLKPNVKHPFLIMEDVCHKDLPLNAPIKTTEHGSKLWAADTIIFDADEAICGIMDVPRLAYNRDKGYDGANQMIMDMLTAYAFRYIFEIVDTCDRNFIINWLTNELYSIDEENYGEGRRTYFVGNKPLPKKDNRQVIFTEILNSVDGSEQLKRY